MKRNCSLPIALAALLGAAACSPRSTVLAIAVSNIPKATRTLEVTLTIDGKAYPASPVFQVDPQRSATTVLTGIEIPWNFTDRLVGIDIAARDMRCPLASYASAAAAVEPGTYTVSAPLQLLQNDELITDLYTIHAVSADEVWAGGANQISGRFDGCYWKKYKFANPSGIASILRIYQHPRVGVWAVGSDGLVARFDDAQQAWQEFSEPLQLYAGATGAKLPTWSDITYLPGGTDELLLVGSSGGNNPSCYAARGTRGAANSYTWKVANALCNANGQAVISTCTGCKFYPAKMNLFDDGSLVISGTSGNTDSGTMTTTYQGAFVRTSDLSLSALEVRLVPVVNGAPNQTLAVWGSAANDFWLAGARLSQVVGSGPATSITLQTQFYNDITNTYAINGFWGSSSNDFWLVAANTSNRFSRLHHITNQNIVDSNMFIGIGNYQLISVHGTSAKDIWFVGNGGLRIHHDGQSFQVIRDL